MVWRTRELLIIGVLILCVPIQYWLVSQMTSGIQPNDAMQELNKEFEKFKWVWFELLDWWRKWYLQFITFVKTTITGEKINPKGECIAKEVLLFRQKTGYFGLSPDLRPYRPDYIKHRVGQVVKLVNHAQQGALGVIIAWDLYARAPEKWLRAQYGDDPELRKEPHYRVILSRPLIREMYVPQRSIKVLRATQINHPRVSDLFSHFDGAQYIPRELLRRLYPMD